MAEHVVSYRPREKPPISLKNVFVVRSETLKVDECAAPGKPSAFPKRWERGLGRKPELIHATFLLTEFVFVY